MKRILHIIVFLLLACSANSQQITYAEYFINTDPGVGNGTYIPVATPADTLIQSFTISTTGLNPGAYHLFVRVRYADSLWSLYEGRTFYINPPNLNQVFKIVKAEYFYNIDPGVGNGIPIVSGPASDSINIFHNIPTTGLSPGFHHLFVRSMDSTGKWSLHKGRTFYINPPNLNQVFPIVAAEYFYSTDPGVGNGIPIVTGPASDSINTTTSISTAGLSPGFHHLFVRVQDSTGKWSLHKGRTFYIDDPLLRKSYKIVTSEYFYDTDPGHGMATPIHTGPPADSVSIVTSLPTTGLANGWHFLYVRVKDSLGRWSLNEVRPFEICNNPPVITVQPTSIFTCINGTATFTVSSQGAGTTFQWKKNGINISGATDSIFINNNISISDTGQYTVVITGLCGAITSNPAILSILSAPAITTQPSGQSVCLGGNVQFIVVVSGSNPSYQWKKDGTNIPGATTSTLAINGVAAANAGAYTLLVTNSCGTVTTVAANLSIIPATTITVQPQTLSVCTGSSLNLSVTATGAGLSYQWYKNNNLISGATGTGYTMPAATAADAGNYTVVVTGTCGTVTSNVAAVTILSAPAITTQPSGQSVCLGGNVQFSAVVSGSNPTYQWKKDGTNIPGATTSILAINGVTAADAGAYTLQVTNSCGTVTTVAANLSIIPATTITVQPQTLSVCIGSSLNLSVTATGAGLSYQWYKNSIIISGATGTGYTMPAATAVDAGNYTVVVTGTCGTVTSNVVAVTILSPPLITTQPLTQAACPGSSIFFTTVVSGANNTYQWKKNNINITGATGDTLWLQNITAADVGAYSVVITNNCGSVTSSVANLTHTNQTVINSQPSSISICSGSTAIFNVTAAGSGLSYQWLHNGTPISGANSSSFNITTANSINAGSYSVIVASNCGSPVTSAAAMLTIDTIPDMPGVITGVPNLCVGTAGIFSVAPVTGATSYTWTLPAGWSGSSTSNSINISSGNTGGTITVTANNGCGSSTPASIAVNILPSPSAVVTVIGDTTICQGDSVVLNASVGTGYSYQWQLNASNITSATNASYVAAQSGMYSVIVAANGCVSASNSVIITVNPLPIASLSSTGNTDLCDGDTMIISTALNNNYNYQWLNNGSVITGAASNSFAVTTGGVFAVIVEENGCKDTSTTLVVNLLQKPSAQISISGLTTFCEGDSVVLSADIQNSVTYQWNMNGSAIAGADSAVLVVKNSGSYEIEVTDGICAATSSTITVKVNPNPVPMISQAGNTLITGTFSSYQWYKEGALISGANNYQLTISEMVWYAVEVTDQNGCYGKDSLLADLASCNVYIPTAFSPNSDGNNDLLIIGNDSYVDIEELQIYNRWGKMVFQTNNLQQSWNGRDENTGSSTGVYIYILKYNCEGVPKIKRGNITLLN